MGVWPSELTVITNKGLNLIAKTPTGASYTLCKAIAGRGKIEPDPGSADPIESIAEKLEVLTEVCDPFLYGVAMPAEYLGNKRARITSILSNVLMEEGADCNMIGVTAIDPDEGEILFMVKQATFKDDIPSRAVMPLSITHKDIVFLGNSKEIKYDPPDDLLVYQAEIKPIKEKAEKAYEVSQEALAAAQDGGGGITITHPGINIPNPRLVLKYIRGNLNWFSPEIEEPEQPVPVSAELELENGTVVKAFAVTESGDVRELMLLPE